MKELFNGITKNDLLKLKDSKAVPITAHSHEVVVPVVYATRVKEFMRKEGMRVPLKPEELQALEQRARNTEGKMEEYAKGGTIKAKKIRAKKVKINQNVVKKGNIKQVVNIKLGEKLIRRPSVRAKAIGRENIPIRPGVSSYAISNQPSYDRMIPSTGAVTNQPLPVAASNLATESRLAKELDKPLRPPGQDIVRPSLATQTEAEKPKYRIIAGPTPYSVLKKSNIAEEAAQKSRTFKMMGRSPPEGQIRGKGDEEFVFKPYGRLKVASQPNP